MLHVSIDNAKTRYRVSLPVRMGCATTTITKGGSGKVTLDLRDEVYLIVATKSTMAKYDHVLLCKRAQYRAGAMWIRQIRAIGGGVVPRPSRTRRRQIRTGMLPASQMDRWVGIAESRRNPLRGLRSQPPSGHAIAKHMPRHPKPKRLGTWIAAAVVVQSPT